MNIKKYIAIALALACAAGMSAQVPTDANQSVFRRLGIFNKLETGVTVGTTGLGLEIASPVTEWAKVRAGVSFMPGFHVPMHFGITTYTDGTSVNSGNFGSIRDLMYKLSGYEMDDQIDVNGIPSMVNFKFLVDVYPIPQNRHWHVTVGFFAGPKRIAKAVNTMEEMPSLLAISMYNRLYDATQAPDFIENAISQPIIGDIYLDPEAAALMQEKLAEYGRIGVHMGDFKDGTPYYMEPGKDGTVRANAYVNAVRWFTGVGYNTSISADRRWNIGVDLGVMYWGGSPKVVTHEGVDMSHDLVGVPGKVGDYVSFMKSLKVYPTLEFKLSYTFQAR